MTDKNDNSTGLAAMRVPFPPHQVLKLPKPSAPKAVMDNIAKGYCNECGGYHAISKIIHLSYVGHAAITNRLLDADPEWRWDPMVVDSAGMPILDASNGIWIRLTVCGVTRIGYGHAQGKSGGDAIKEAIGDAIRNAAMRFGAALELWHKGSLFDETEAQRIIGAAEPEADERERVVVEDELARIADVTTIANLVTLRKSLSEKCAAADDKPAWEQLDKATRDRKAELESQAK